MELNTLLAEKRDDILRLARRHGVKKVSIFGSVVRGEAGEGSDIDFLVEMEDGRSLLDLIAFQLDVETLLECKVDIVSRKGLSPYLAEYILAEEVPM